ncbi:DUF1419 domain-containing protein [Bradyrhizobium sp. LB12.1]
MHRMFNRHRGNPAMAEGEARQLFAGEWFEIAESEYDYMLELLPPLWMSSPGSGARSRSSIALMRSPSRVW